MSSCAYLIRQNPITELVRDGRTIHIRATFENDLRKKNGHESANGDFQCAKLKYALQIRQIVGGYDKIRNSC